MPHEVGPALSSFPDLKHFARWLRLTPGTAMSSGKPLRPKESNDKGTSRASSRSWCTRGRACKGRYRKQTISNPRVPAESWGYCLVSQELSSSRSTSTQSRDAGCCFWAGLVPVRSTDFSNS